MTRAQRRIRAEKARATSAGLVTTFAADRGRIMGLTTNPNDGKRHGRNATHRHNGLTTAEREAITAERRRYIPLTVRTRLDYAASGRKLAARYRTESAYTI